jgi:protein kinase X
LEDLGLLGVGTFGTVRLVAHSRLGRKHPFALKTLRKSLLVRHKQVAHVVSEASIMSECEHPFIARLEAVFETAVACHLLMEPVLGGELFTLMHVHEAALTEADAVMYGAMVVSALEYLHGRNVAYRDLKPENLLLDQHGFLKLVDFGFAKRLTEGRTFTQCGTPEYMAPEVLLNEGHGLTVDWWALGILVFEMLAGYPPFRNCGDDADLCRRIVSTQPCFPPGMRQLARDLVSALLCGMPCDRLGCGGAGEVKAHPFLAGVAWEALLSRRVEPPPLPHLPGEFDVSCFETFEDVHAAGADAEPTEHLPQGILDGIVAARREPDGAAVTCACAIKM